MHDPSSCIFHRRRDPATFGQQYLLSRSSLPQLGHGLHDDGSSVKFRIGKNGWRHRRVNSRRTLTDPAADPDRPAVPQKHTWLNFSKRVLRAGGKVVFSFLEFSEPSHGWAFETEMNMRRAGGNGHLNSLIERNAIAIWAQRFDIEVKAIVPGTDAPGGGEHLGQAVAVLVKQVS